MHLIDRLFHRAKTDQPFRSADYWRVRCADGGKSGSGSCGRLAEYKARTINSLAEEKTIGNVIEFGSGDGNQCSLLTVTNYLGVDISEQIVKACRARFAEREHWTFLTDEEYQAAPIKAELAMSPDVINHLPEGQALDRYMRTLFGASSHFVLIYSSDHDATTNADRVRHRSLSDLVRLNAPGFALVESFSQSFPMGPGSDKHNTSFAAFKLFEAAKGNEA